MEKCALVIGGTSGIGGAISEVLAKNFNVVMIYKKDHDEAKKQVDRLNKLETNHKFQAIACDITDREIFLQTYKEIKANFGVPEVIVNSAGGFGNNLFILEPEKLFYDLMLVNYLGPVNVCKTILPDLMKKRMGRIIQISSTTVGASIMGHSAYAASKAALEKFSTILAGEVIQYGITVNIIRPGFVRTPSLENWFKGIADDKEKLRLTFGPLGTPISASEIGRAVLYLIESIETTGMILDIDGGKNKFFKM